jgi:hypothetical protein
MEFSYRPVATHKTHRGEAKMEISRDQLIARIQALSMQKHFGIDVSNEVQELLHRCQSEEDKKLALTLCRALGLN